MRDASQRDSSGARSNLVFAQSQEEMTAVMVGVRERAVARVISAAVVIKYIWSDWNAAQPSTLYWSVTLSPWARQPLMGTLTVAM
jgi:hypothetical protein